MNFTNIAPDQLSLFLIDMKAPNLKCQVNPSDLKPDIPLDLLKPAIILKNLKEFNYHDNSDVDQYEFVAVIPFSSVKGYEQALTKFIEKSFLSQNQAFL